MLHGGYKWHKSVFLLWVLLKGGLQRCIADIEGLGSKYDGLYDAKFPKNQ